TRFSRDWSSDVCFRSHSKKAAKKAYFCREYIAYAREIKSHKGSLGRSGARAKQSRSHQRHETVCPAQQGVQRSWQDRRSIPYLRSEERRVGKERRSLW